MTKLNQLIAVEAGLKTSTTKATTEVYRTIGRSNLFAGITRTYTPKDDDGDQLPAESTLVQTNVKTALEAFQKASERLFDVTLTKERANTKATADVVVDGKVILKDAPVTYLLFLEKKLVDINTFALSLPTLDSSSPWEKDENTGNYVTLPVSTVRTKKVPKAFIKSAATDKHPAQVEIFHEDIIVGTWTKRDLSGAIPVTVKADLLARIEKLSSAVKFAREEANSIEVKDEVASGAVFTYLFG